MTHCSRMTLQKWSVKLQCWSHSLEDRRHTFKTGILTFTSPTPYNGTTVNNQVLKINKHGIPLSLPVALVTQNIRAVRMAAAMLWRLQRSCKSLHKMASSIHFIYSCTVQKIVNLTRVNFIVWCYLAKYRLLNLTWIEWKLSWGGYK